jgi:hypothetical protein
MLLFKSANQARERLCFDDSLPGICSETSGVVSD